jgi:hypothetical protein
MFANQLLRQLAISLSIGLVASILLVVSPYLIAFSTGIYTGFVVHLKNFVLGPGLLTYWQARDSGLVTILYGKISEGSHKRYIFNISTALWCLVFSCVSFLLLPGKHRT